MTARGTRRGIVVGVASIAITCLAFASPVARAASRDRSARPATTTGVEIEDPAVTGSWQVTVSVPAMNMAFKSLFTFGRDGTLIGSQAFVLPNVMGFPNTQWLVYSTAHGTWKRTPGGNYTFVFVALVHNEQGQFLFTSRATGTIVVGTGGDTLSGTATASDVAENGTPIVAFDASLVGTRLALE